MTHQITEEHADHTHGPDCGHETIQHGDHVDYLHNGHRHVEHDDHYDECTTCACGNCKDECKNCSCADCTCPTCDHAA